MPQTASHAPADHFTLIIEGICHALARNGRVRGLAGPFLLLIWGRLRRMAFRFTRAMAVPPSRPRPNRPPRPRGSPLPLPRGRAWLLRLVPESASGASQLRHFLADPEVAACLAADPRLGRIIRPLCHALGIRVAGNRPTQTLSVPEPPAAARPACRYGTPGQAPRAAWLAAPENPPPRNKPPDLSAAARLPSPSPPRR